MLLIPDLPNAFFHPLLFFDDTASDGQDQLIDDLGIVDHRFPPHEDPHRLLDGVAARLVASPDSHFIQRQVGLKRHQPFGDHRDRHDRLGHGRRLPRRGQPDRPEEGRPPCPTPIHHTGSIGQGGHAPRIRRLVSSG